MTAACVELKSWSFLSTNDCLSGIPTGSGSALLLLEMYLPHPFWSSISPLHGDSPSGPAGIVHPSWSKPPSATPPHAHFEVLAAVVLPKSSSPSLSHCILLRCNVGRKARKTAKFSCWLLGCSCCCWKPKSLGRCNPPPEKKPLPTKAGFLLVCLFLFFKRKHPQEGSLGSAAHPHPCLTSKLG